MRPVTTGSNVRRSYNRVIDDAGDNPYASMYSAAFGHTSRESKKQESPKKRDNTKTKEDKQRFQSPIVAKQINKHRGSS